MNTEKIINSSLTVVYFYVLWRMIRDNKTINMYLKEAREKLFKDLSPKRKRYFKRRARIERFKIKLSIFLFKITRGRFKGQL